jgi:WD40 repeat protein
MQRLRLLSISLAVLFLAMLFPLDLGLARADSANRKPITATNVSDLAVVKRFGEGLINSARWTERGNLFVECASTGLWIYDGANIDASPRLLEGSTRCERFDMNADGTLLAWTSNQINNYHETNGYVVFVVDTRTGKHQQFTLIGKGPTSESLDGVRGVKLSQDGLLVAALDENTGFGTVDIWDIATGSIIAIFDTGGAASQPPFFSLDNSLEVKRVGSALQLRDRKTRKVQHIIQGFDWVSDAFSPDGRLSARSSESSYNNFTGVYYAQNGAKRSNLAGHSNSVSFSPDSKTLAVGQDDGSIGFFDPLTLKQKFVIKAGASIPISIAYRPDGKILASVAEDLTVRFWDIETQQQVSSHGGGNLALVRVHFSPDETLIAATGNRSLYVWDAVSGTKLVSQRIKNLRPDDEWLYRRTDAERFSPIAVGFAANGSQVFTSDMNDPTNVWDRQNNPLNVWDAQTGKLQGKQPVVPGLFAYFAGDQTIFTASERQVRHFDLAASAPNNVLQTYNPEFLEAIKTITISKDASTIAVSNRSEIQLWDVKTAQRKMKITVADHDVDFFESVTTLALNNDGTLLAFARLSGKFEIWDTATSKLLTTAEIHHSGYLEGDFFPFPVAFSPDASLLVVGSSITGELVFIDVKTGQVLRVMQLHQNGVTDLQFNADGSRLLSAGLDGAVFILEISPQATF